MNEAVPVVIPSTQSDALAPRLRRRDLEPIEPVSEVDVTADKIAALGFPR